MSLRKRVRSRRAASAWRRFWMPLRLTALAACLLVFCASFASAQERMTVRAEMHENYGRIILNFPNRFDLPAYKLGSENGVLFVVFDEKVTLSLPDISGTLPSYISVARLDPDKHGLRMGLKGVFRINTTEAGEKLFIDILGKNWVGLLPGLPPEVIAELSRRSADAAIAAERKRKAEIVLNDRPTATIRVGRHPTFSRIQIDWSIDSEAKFDFADGIGNLTFDWPVPVDLYPLKVELPPGLQSATNEVVEDGTRITLKTADGVVPRFYQASRSSFIIDIDETVPDPGNVDVASLLPIGDAPFEATNMEQVGAHDEAAVDPEALPEGTQTSVTPLIEQAGETVRVRFPFDRETPAAVFRRGDTVWMIFDTAVAINTPPPSALLDSVATDFTTVTSGSSTIIRMKMAEERLATLGSEGRSWVLSLGDLLLSPSEVLGLSRKQTDRGLFEVIADVARPYQIHQIRDPEVGDILDVVTLYPPARGLVRDLSYVDFSALRSVHGLVIKPNHEDVQVALEDKLAVISADRGLIVSSPQGSRATDSREADLKREGFIDLNGLYEPDIALYHQRETDFLNQASEAEKRELDTVRLRLGQYYLANDLSYEALGVLNVMRKDITVDQLHGELDMSTAAADTLAGRTDDALKILNTEPMSARADALLWRTIARNQSGEFQGSRTDALSAEAVYQSYPPWVQTKFLLAAAQSAIEVEDFESARRYVNDVATSRLDSEMLTNYQVLSARIDEADGKFDEALDTYGQVIAADFRPTRAEAIYRTMLVLDKMHRLDAARAADTLSTELTTWRDNPLETKMQDLLAKLYFRRDEYRNAFETVRDMAQLYPESDLTSEMVTQSRQIFSDLYLDGKADSLPPVDALTLYYDFRQMTPPGARGDEMVRNLARRLIKVDLLSEAGELLQYQIDHRLKGAARSQIAADLAVIYLTNHAPQKALEVLNDTRTEGLPPALVRQRRLLEAKALIDAGREDLSLEIMQSLDGRDADLLRIDAMWRTKRYREAAEILEVMFIPTDNEPLSDIARRGIIRSAVGYVLANDKIGLSRLRDRYSEQMAQSTQWPIFALVTGETKVTSLEFQKVAHEVADVDSLKQFLMTYKEVYSDEGALAPNV